MKKTYKKSLCVTTLFGLMKMELMVNHSYGDLSSSTASHETVKAVLLSDDGAMPATTPAASGFFIKDILSSR